MKSREPVEVTIESVSGDGCGYSADGRYAVYGALSGETVLANPIARKRKRLYLRADEITNSAATRIEPECPAAIFCGGCVFQHMHHDAQLQLKQDHLRQSLAPIEPDSWLAPLSGPRFHYRSKARLGVKFVEKKGRVLVGFREKHKPYIADITGCPVLCEPVSSLIPDLEALIAATSIPRAIPQIEVASGDANTAIILRHLEPFSEQDEQLLAAFGERHQIKIFLQPGKPESTHLLFPSGGDELLDYSLPDHGLNFRFAAHDFTQVNLEMNRKMVNLAIDLLDLSASDSVLDGFCGIGNFSLAVARHAGRVIGAEQSPASIDRARENARQNGVNNATFEVVDLHAEDPEVPGFTGVNKVLLDPPRTGAQELVKTLASVNVSRVVYVSCNPETLARDVKILAENGFDLRSAGIIDMFPHTTHVESIALLVRRE